MAVALEMRGLSGRQELDDPAQESPGEARPGDDSPGFAMAHIRRGMLRIVVDTSPRFDVPGHSILSAGADVSIWSRHGCQRVAGSCDRSVAEGDPGRRRRRRADPGWSLQYQSAEVLERFDDGRPRKVVMKVKAAGITDEQTIEYTWADTWVSWTLIKAGQLRSQDGNTLTPDGDKTKLRFDIAIDLARAAARVRGQADHEGRPGVRHRRSAQAGPQRSRRASVNQ